MLVLDLLPHHEEDEVIRWLEGLRERHPLRGMGVALRERLPKRFADNFWARLAARACGCTEDATLGGVQPGTFMALSRLLKHWEVPVVGTEGYPKAEVTCGGVATEELAEETMEVKRHPGLFFIGEAVDVTGWLGGYNFQW